MAMTKTIKFAGRPVWAEISLQAILHNLRAIRKQVGASRKILAVVKSNAYGLGAVAVAKALQKAGTEWFGVTCANEGVELREAGIRKRILILTGFWPGEEKRLIQNNLTPTVTRVDDLGHLERSARAAGGKSRVRFHLKINTGMNRLGIAADEVDSFARALAACKHIELEGTFTHFASAEDFTAQQTNEQEKVFLACLERLRALGVSPGIVHMANSGAICARPSTWADMVRPGAPLGAGVGYAARFLTKRPSRIAVINAGYADGVVRARTNRGWALVRGKRVPLVGTISMDLTMLDLTDVPEAVLGDVVTIYGKDGDAAIEVSEVAHEIGTVTSDLLCALGRRVPKFYV
jgi:alanine racemase